MHWRFWIQKYGSPAHYSTMVWESKHKQLKFIKANQTNNTNHSKDIAQKDIDKTLLLLRNLPPYKAEVFFMETCSNYSIYIFLLIYMQVIDNCRLMNKVARKDMVEMSNAFKSRLAQFFIVPESEDFLQYNSMIWDLTKYTVGDNVALFASDNQMWYGKIDMIIGLKQEGFVKEAAVKVQWYNVYSNETIREPGKYMLTDTFDIQHPAVLNGYVLVIRHWEDEEHMELYFIQPHFRRHYRRYFKNNK